MWEKGVWISMWERNVWDKRGWEICEFECEGGDKVGGRESFERCWCEIESGCVDGDWERSVR